MARRRFGIFRRERGEQLDEAARDEAEYAEEEDEEGADTDAGDDAADADTSESDAEPEPGTDELETPGEPAASGEAKAVFDHGGEEFSPPTGLGVEGEDAKRVERLAEARGKKAADVVAELLREPIA